ncbi:MAG: Holliday junction DNA helicase RuvA [Alphaproteobacteria bacterium RIFCSPLOWO2_01_FULL_40_26]|nr:MAG: Holliday junction DNA helicase RuvA [Alphaproteobacteria bacterium RIFCSPHIGHO2_02_FULL_40_34]OFW94599.1 MAG: Holliday junction DNA helicase RuvA [Alphaproteobacteria bacterium RIFCSPLOWO2_01_FULL_40_26]OFX10066.1 MAG: Holliday junction DNA helicase RuvA [Alphaproteobacteria bacterium RIFCSPLOWO2_02_FULL_40_19]OFX11699.1 MAG: Holliday junction DNA helicase RuvA [Alphaproteobacteria bacterium RIFCSPLOWO2_12_FULL_40_11]
MISKLRGFIDLITEDKCVIDVNGVGYLIFISQKTAAFLSQFPREKEVSLTIETVVKEDAIELYGFALEIEKTWFLELIKVQGVGAKMGQKILSALSIEDLAKALISSDEKTFSKISGIGPKLASRITTELKNSPKKLGIGTEFDITKHQNPTKISSNQTAIDALSALENLGYKKHDCLRVIEFVSEQNPKITLENLITSSLRELSKNKF